MMQSVLKCFIYLMILYTLTCNGENTSLEEANSDWQTMIDSQVKDMPPTNKNFIQTASEVLNGFLKPAEEIGEDVIEKSESIFNAIWRTIKKYILIFIGLGVLIVLLLIAIVLLLWKISRHQRVETIIVEKNM